MKVRIFVRDKSKVLGQPWVNEVEGSLLQKELLQKDKILIRDCLSFRELGDRYFRVAVRLEHENQKLINVLSKLS